MVQSSAHISTEQPTQCSFTVSEVMQLLLFHDHMDFMIFQGQAKELFSCGSEEGRMHILQISLID